MIRLYKSEDQLARKRAQNRAAATRRRRLEKVGGYVYKLALPEWLVVGALTATNRPGTDFTDHQECEALLAVLVYKHLERVMDSMKVAERAEFKIMDPVVEQLRTK